MGRTTEYLEDDYAAFLVEDDTGTAYVDPEGSDLMLKSGDEVVVPGGEEPPRHVREFLERETDLDPVHKRKRWFEEHRLGVGDPVYVAGQATAAPDGSATTAIGDGVSAPKFFVSDEPEHDLGTQLWKEALVSFVAAATLFAFAYLFHVM